MASPGPATGSTLLTLDRLGRNMRETLNLVHDLTQGLGTPCSRPHRQLETHLHHQLADRRVNLVNMRREFFRARPAEVRDILARVDASIVTWSTTLRLVVDA